MKLIKLTRYIYNLDEPIIASVYINIDHITVIQEIDKRNNTKYKHPTVISLINEPDAVGVCEDIEEVIRRIHLQTIKWEDGQFFINGEPQAIKGE
tara:strand:+ start:45 stop:329 length:285 start_codon:yes stop_codon:yes gene_type:complete